ncbi:hypothetical protein BV898_09138 [Hypsibius exemplaris]|uniref:Uncharacterized protein n=1 Tax=Hypsibius exemplaris TaxID=2072580 RepID=A0A1W0WNN2_HYPEX|nr:hypothetical protein BV898_09138 [Hypsibius exemplaris]
MGSPSEQNRQQDLAYGTTSACFGNTTHRGMLLYQRDKSSAVLFKCPSYTLYRPFTYLTVSEVPPLELPVRLATTVRPSVRLSVRTSVRPSNSASPIVGSPTSRSVRLSNTLYRPSIYLTVSALPSFQLSVYSRSTHRSQDIHHSNLTSVSQISTVHLPPHLESTFCPTTRPSPNWRPTVHLFVSTVPSTVSPAFPDNGSSLSLASQPSPRLL